MNKRNYATQNAENKRHNFISEKLTRRANKELGRHNLVTEANQRAETAAGITRSNIAAEASKYGADASASASRYAADTSAAASKYAADQARKAAGYTADRNAQTQLTIAQINKDIQAANNAVKKAIADDQVNEAKRSSLAKNASDQFIKQLDRELKKYEIDKANEVKYQELQQKLANQIAKGGKYSNTLSQILSLFGFTKSEIKQIVNKLK